jgi:hypothetical protein
LVPSRFNPGDILLSVVFFVYGSKRPLYIVRRFVSRQIHCPKGVVGVVFVCTDRSADERGPWTKEVSLLAIKKGYLIPLAE